MTQVYLICWRSGVERWWICETTNPAALKGLAHEFQFVTWLDGPGRLPTYVDMTLLIFMSEASAIVRFVITRPSHTLRSSAAVLSIPLLCDDGVRGCCWCGGACGLTHRLPGNPRDEDARGWAVWAFPLTTGYRITACISCQFVCSRETEEWSAATMMQGKMSLSALKFIACLLMLCISALLIPVTLTSERSTWLFWCVPPWRRWRIMCHTL